MLVRSILPKQTIVSIIGKQCEARYTCSHVMMYTIFAVVGEAASYLKTT